jgi:hypothetical protein
MGRNAAIRFDRRLTRHHMATHGTAGIRAVVESTVAPRTVRRTCAIVLGLDVSAAARPCEVRRPEGNRAQHRAAASKQTRKADKAAAREAASLRNLRAHFRASRAAALRAS